MYLLKNLRKEQLAIALGFALGAVAIVYPQQSFGAADACSSTAAQARLKERETALLGPNHAEHHAEARAHQCRVAKGLEKVARLSAPALAAAQAQPTNSVGQWSDPPFGIPVVGITSVLLYNGKVLFWSYNPDTSNNTGVAYVWDPADKTGQTGHSITPPENIWCGGQTILGDGSVYVAGGNLRRPDPTSGTGFEGSLSNYTFNPTTEIWTKQPDMSVGRWYPTTTQLADNRVVITSGFDQTGSQQITQAVDVFTPAATIDGVGMTAYLGVDSDHNPTGLYPYQYLMPSGKMLQAGPDYTNASLLTPGVSWSWSDIPANLPHMLSSHYGLGNGIIYTDASVTPIKQVIMIAGGTGMTEAVSNNEWLDSTNPTAGWKSYPQWLLPRHNSNTVILPDGKLFTVGGNSANTNYDNPLFESELFNKPANDPTGLWVQMAPNSIPAAYHSSAILLPDATVLLSQDDLSAASDHKAQVYSPPYLFAGTRPQITSAPNALSVGQTFSMTVNTRKINSVVLIAPGAVTHGNDMHQRFIKLRSRTKGSNVEVTIPASSSLVPPGYYMLFVVDSKGIPSVSQFVRVS